MVLVACGGKPAHAPRRSIAETCDVSAAEASPRRAWLASTETPAVVLGVRGGEVQVAHVAADVVVTRWVPAATLRRALGVPMAVSRTPGGAPDPDLRVLPGFPVDATTTPWTRVLAKKPLEVAGYVPTSATTTIFEPQPVDEKAESVEVFAVKRAPRDDAPVTSVVRGEVHVRRTGSAPGDWDSVIATARYAEVSGFVWNPAPEPREFRRFGSMEFSDDMIDGAVDPWLPFGTCLRTSPDGPIVGTIVGRLRDKPEKVSEGVFAIRVEAPWGRADYYAHGTIPDDEEEESEPDGAAPSSRQRADSPDKP